MRQTIGYAVCSASRGRQNTKGDVRPSKVNSIAWAKVIRPNPAIRVNVSPQTGLPKVIRGDSADAVRATRPRSPQASGA